MPNLYFHKDAHGKLQINSEKTRQEILNLLLSETAAKKTLDANIQIKKAIQEMESTEKSFLEPLQALYRKMSHHKEKVIGRLGAARAQWVIKALEDGIQASTQALKAMQDNLFKNGVPLGLENATPSEISIRLSNCNKSLSKNIGLFETGTFLATEFSREEQEDISEILEGARLNIATGGIGSAMISMVQRTPRYGLFNTQIQDNLKKIDVDIHQRADLFLKKLLTAGPVSINKMVEADKNLALKYLSIVNRDDMKSTPWVKPDLEIDYSGTNMLQAAGIKLNEAQVKRENAIKIKDYIKKEKPFVSLSTPFDNKDLLSYRRLLLSETQNEQSPFYNCDISGINQNKIKIKDPDGNLLMQAKVHRRGIKLKLISDENRLSSRLSLEQSLDLLGHGIKHLQDYLIRQNLKSHFRAQYSSDSIKAKVGQQLREALEPSALSHNNSRSHSYTLSESAPSENSLDRPQSITSVSSPREDSVSRNSISSKPEGYILHSFKRPSMSELSRKGSLLLENKTFILAKLNEFIKSYKTGKGVERAKMLTMAASKLSSSSEVSHFLESEQMILKDKKAPKLGTSTEYQLKVLLASIDKTLAEDKHLIQKPKR